MKNDNCKQIEELLVDFADGELNEFDRVLVEEHLDGCPSCAETAKALKNSLSMAQVIWQDNLDGPIVKRRPVRRYIQIAAGLLIVAGLFFVSYNKPEEATTSEIEIAQADTLPTLAEIELQIEMEGIAAMVLARAEMIKKNPGKIANPAEYLQSEYRHIVKMYPETLTAIKAAKLIH